MAEKFEEQYRDVLQNIEFALVPVYREHPKMTDYGALYVVEPLIDTYNAEMQRRRSRSHNSNRTSRRPTTA